MTDVGITAAGQIKFTMESRPIHDILFDAARTILTDLDNTVIDGILVSTNDTHRYLGVILSEMCGIQPRISHTVESMCGSGGNAIMSAYSHIKSGLARSILVVGAELPNSPGGILKWDMSRGQFQSPIYWGSILTKSYKRRYDISDESVSTVAAKNHSLAADNPDALYGHRCTPGDVIQSKEITADLHLLDCSRACTGASAILISDADTCRTVTDDTVWIRSISQCVLSATFGRYSTYDRIESTGRAARDAYKMADITPDMIDVVEVHDAFSICEIMATESLQMVEYGRGAAYAHDLYVTESRKVNPRGGILGSGHPLGATGISQMVEIFRQLRGEAKDRQVPDAYTGVTQGMSTAGTSSLVAVMQR